MKTDFRNERPGKFLRDKLMAISTFMGIKALSATFCEVS